MWNFNTAPVGFVTFTLLVHPAPHLETSLPAPGLIWINLPGCDSAQSNHNAVLLVNSWSHLRFGKQPFKVLHGSAQKRFHSKAPAVPRKETELPRGTQGIYPGRSTEHTALCLLFSLVLPQETLPSRISPLPLSCATW